MRRATFQIEGDYGGIVIIPKIQNLYEPEKVANGWQYGYKYDSGIFEYIPCKTFSEALTNFKRLRYAIDRYYNV